MEAPHSQLEMAEVLKTLSEETEPLTARTFYEPWRPFLPYKKERRGRFNVEGRILHMLGVPYDELAILTPEQARAIFEHELVGSSAMQRGLLPYFDSRRFAMRHRTGPAIAGFLTHPDRLLAERAIEVGNLAELVYSYTSEQHKLVQPVDWFEGSITGMTSPATKAKNTIQMAAYSYFQSLPMYQKDERRYADSIAQTIMENTCIGLPKHIRDSAIWAANEIQLVGDDGKISGRVIDLSTGTVSEIRAELYFLPHLVSPDGIPGITRESLMDYSLKGLEPPKSPRALARDVKRIVIRMAEIRHERAEQKAKQDQQTLGLVN